MVRIIITIVIIIIISPGPGRAGAGWAQGRQAAPHMCGVSGAGQSARSRYHLQPSDQGPVLARRPPGTGKANTMISNQARSAAAPAQRRAAWHNQNDHCQLLQESGAFP